MIKNIFLYLLIIPGILLILITAVSVRLTEGLNTEQLQNTIKYVEEFSRGEVIDQDASIIYYLEKIKEYSHILYTIATVWLVSIIYIIESKRREKNGKNQKEI